MIPRIIHQTWRDNDLPVPVELPESWKNQNPNWEYRFWTDNELLDFVSEFYPDLRENYLSYPSPVQRSDVARYLLLSHFGGVYADIDTRCIGSLEPIVNERRVILASEPEEHWNHTDAMGIEGLLFNGVMASPKGHKFWDHVIKNVVLCFSARDYTLESTGPIMLTGCASTFEEKDQLAIHSCHLFTPQTKFGEDSQSVETGPLSPYRVCEHLWMGSWYNPRRKKFSSQLKLWMRKARYYATRGQTLRPEQLMQTVDQNLLAQPIAAQDFVEPTIAVLTPVRDAGPFLDRYIELLRSLDFPQDKLHIMFCEGDSQDDTRQRIEEIQRRYAGDFAGIELLTFDSGYKIERKNRWKPRHQPERRSNLASVRNYLLKHALGTRSQWVLWLDVDVCDCSPNTLRRLLSIGKKVVVPNCVLDWGQKSFDQNSFLEVSSERDARYYKHVRKGVFLPPETYDGRRHLHDMRFLPQAPLDSIGGTMALVHSSVHQAGISFPEQPYKDLLETEGFGKICSDFGVRPCGLPNLEIRHVRS